MRRPTVVILSVLLLASLGWIGHAAMDQGSARIARELNQTLHLLAAGLWLGGLVPLGWLLLRARGPQNDVDVTLARDIVRRFSHVGYVAVALTALTGAINSFLVVRSLGAMVETEYGRLLALKILLFLAMLVMALVNRFLLSPRIDRDASALLALYRSMGCELGLGLCILAIVSVLGTLPPAIHGNTN